VSFTWPLALLLLLVVPALLGAYLLQRRRKRAGAVRYSSVALIRSAIPAHSRWKRHIPMALFLAGLTSLALGSARPQASVEVPLGRTSIILALDVSRSMCVTDVKPNRLTVAQEAARRFIKDQSDGTRIGIVAFAGFAELVVPPTTDKKTLITAIDGFTTARGTAIGAATLKSIDAIASVNPEVSTVTIGDGTDAFDAGPPTAPNPDAPVTQGTVPPPTQGYVPDIVVLLTDGANTRGIHPIEAAREAVKRRIRVYTIGFGTTNPSDPVCTAQQLGGEVFAGGGGGFGNGRGGFGGGGSGFRSFLVADEPTLKEVARMTGGRYFKAEDAGQLRKVFDNLPRQIVLQKRKVELSAVFAGIGGVLAAAAMALSLLWNRSP
jgi:Ca-activated chloride channel homolog